LIEPVLNPTWVWLVHGEEPGLWSMVGGGLILLGTVTRVVSTALRNRD